MKKTLTLLLLFLGSYAYAQTVLLETFDNTSTPTGWTRTQSSGLGWRFSTGAGYDVSSILDHTGNGGNYAWVDFSGTDAGVILESPPIDVSSLTTPYLEFYHESHYTGTLSPFNFLYLEAWNGTAWANVNTFQGNTPFGWDRYGFNMSTFTYSSQDSLRFRFRCESGGAGNDFNNDLLIDDVEVMELPTCPTPNNLGASNITLTTADIDWVEVGTATQWQIEWGVAGFSQGTGNLVTTTTKPYMLTGLPHSSAIELYVRSICTPGDTSSWLVPTQFTTPCGVISAPWLESFDNATRPTCWVESGSESWQYSTSAAYNASSAGDHTGNGGNYTWIDGSAPNGASQVSTLSSPQIDISTLTTPQLSFWVFSHNTNDNTYNTLTVEFYDGGTWHPIRIINSDQGPQWRNITTTLTGYTISGPVQVRFTIAENSPRFPYYNDILLDDIEFREFRDDGIFYSQDARFNDPCDCDDSLNQTIGGVTYFHDTLTYISMTADSVQLDTTGTSGFFASGGSLYPDSIAFSVTQDSIYKIEYWRPSGVQPVVFVLVDGVRVAVPPSTFQPLCFESSCVAAQPIPTLSDWGLIVLTLSLLCTMVVASRRQSKHPPSHLSPSYHNKE